MISLVDSDFRGNVTLPSGVFTTWHRQGGSYFALRDEVDPDIHVTTDRIHVMWIADAPGTVPTAAALDPALHAIRLLNDMTPEDRYHYLRRDDIFRILSFVLHGSAVTVFTEGGAIFIIVDTYDGGDCALHGDRTEAWFRVKGSHPGLNITYIPS